MKYKRTKFYEILGKKSVIEREIFCECASYLKINSRHNFIGVKERKEKVSLFTS
jgi:hypothetical protein